MNILLEPFQYDFFVRALFMGALMGVVCALLGIFVIMRREALMSHALANTAFLGIAMGLLLGINLHWSMFALTLISAVVISYLQQRRSLPEDSLLEFIAQLTFAFAVICISLLQGYRVDLFQYLFGDILGVSSSDVWIQAPILIILLLIFLALKRQFLKLTLSRELAVSQKVPIFFLNTLFLMLVAIVVAIGMKVIGVILISAFLVLPANTSRILSSNFKSMQIGAVIVGLLGSTLGLFLSYYFNIPSGASIVLTLSILLITAFFIKIVRESAVGK
ncbi:MAG: metal ABC transporter permease [Candidatus Gracilibacteria bacterium]